MAEGAEEAPAVRAVRIDDAGLAALYRDMTPPERRTFWACFAGWGLDGLDYMIHPLVTGTIIKL